MGLSEEDELINLVAEKKSEETFMAILSKLKGKKSFLEMKHKLFYFHIHNTIITSTSCLCFVMPLLSTLLDRPYGQEVFR